MTATEPLTGDLNVIVVTWNSSPHLGDALDALPPWAHPIVIDNASSDDSAQVARSHGATVIALPDNLGFPAAVNCALAHVTAPFVLLLNPDLVVAPDAVRRCLEIITGDVGIGVVGTATRLPDGSPEPAAARRDRRAWHVVVESLGLVHISRRFDLQMIHDRVTDRDVDAVNGAFMLIRTTVLRSLNGLDESCFMYLEDMDLCRRVRNAGLRVRFAANAAAIHLGGASTARGDAAQRARAYLHRIDADLEFFRRYGRPGEPALAIGAYLLRAIFGLLVAAVLPDRRLRYRSALVFTLKQIRGRSPAPPI